MMDFSVESGVDSSATNTEALGSKSAANNSFDDRDPLHRTSGIYDQNHDDRDQGEDGYHGNGEKGGTVPQGTVESHTYADEERAEAVLVKSMNIFLKVKEKVKT